jgi:hypothetical protein
MLKGTIKGGFSITGKTARWQLPHPQVIAETLAANALALTRFVGAITSLQILLLTAFHALGSFLRFAIN